MAIPPPTPSTPLLTQYEIQRMQDFDSYPVEFDEMGMIDIDFQPGWLGRLFNVKGRLKC